MAVTDLILPDDVIMSKILLIRGKKVMLDKDLAQMYGVETKVLKQAVRRNIIRFPSDFMFELNKQEIDILRSQFVTSSWGGSRYKHFAFTEQGVAMLSSVLRSEIAIEINIKIIRVFTKMRELFSLNKELIVKLEQLERKILNNSEDLNDNSARISILWDLFNKIQESKDSSKRKKIGYI